MVKEEAGIDGEVEENTITVKLKHAIPSENAFRLTCARARSTLKMNVLCYTSGIDQLPILKTKKESV